MRRLSRRLTTFPSFAEGKSHFVKACFLTHLIILMCEAVAAEHLLYYGFWRHRISDRYPRVCASSVHVLSSSSCCIHTSHICDLFPAGPKHLLGPLRSRTGFKVYVLTSWCKWVRYPAPRPSPQPLHRRAICAAKSGNSAPRTKHLENQLDLFLHGQAECQTTQGFLAHNVFLHHLIFYFRFFSLFFFFPEQSREVHQRVCLLLKTMIILSSLTLEHLRFRLANLI